MGFGAPPMLVNIFNMQNWADDRTISGMWRWLFVPEERARLWGQQGPFGCPSLGLAPGAGAGAGRQWEEAGVAAGDAPLLPSACPQPAKRLHFWFWLAVPGCLLQRQLLYCLSLLFGVLYSLLFSLLLAEGSESLVWGAVSSWCSMLVRQHWQISGCSAVWQLAGT